VDRNSAVRNFFFVFTKSPSSRRAWIEIAFHKLDHQILLVALLAEGVDRNKNTGQRWKQKTRSPSSRRAWIEIRYSPP